jgi:hypothetical protein
MNSQIRKKSPRAPSIALDEAIDRAIRIYDKERRHSAPIDVIAQDIGYKNSSNGAALQVLASLRYFGLVDRPQEGLLAVTKEVEEYKFAPSESMRKSLLIKWLKTPTIFADLLDKYLGGLPSDATLRFDLIQKGFSQSTAEACLKVFRRSVDYCRYFDELSPTVADVEEQAEGEGEVAAINQSAPPPFVHPVASLAEKVLTDMDRIPVRLTGGRRGWIEIPVPFFEADKARLKAQIDLILTDDESDSN